MARVEVRVEAAGKTVVSVVREALGVPWKRAESLCTTGRVEVDGVTELKPARRLGAGARVAVDPTGPRLRGGVLARDAIVHVDRDLVVVRKPPGVLSVPYESGDKDTLVDRTRAALRRLGPVGKRYDPQLGVVQRLDKDTSGLLVFTRTLAAKRELAQQLRKHDIERLYVAIVHGDARRATHDTLLIRDRGDGLRGSHGVFRRPRGPAPRDAQRAVTHVEVVERLVGATLVRCRLETGRQHQIRIHLSEAGNPLVGEHVYIREHKGERIPAPRPMLHATRLGFAHPRSGERLVFDDPPPPDFAEVLARLRRPRS
jgi:23S rRNA pseudouridine1911/1915/1917 synthase